MQRPRQEVRNEQITPIDERLLAAYEEVELLREQVETSRQWIESLKKELQETQQELEYTNQDLRNALRLNELEFEQAIELAQTILRSEKSASESLAQLIAAIYGYAVQLKELLPTELSSVKTTPLNHTKTEKIAANLEETRNRSRELRTDSERLSRQFKEIGTRFIGSKAHFVRNKERFNVLSAELQAENDVCDCRIECGEVSYPPPQKTCKVIKFYWFISIVYNSI